MAIISSKSQQIKNQNGKLLLSKEPVIRICGLLLLDYFIAIMAKIFFLFKEARYIMQIGIKIQKLELIFLKS
jgi:hypothetical protein